MNFNSHIGFLVPADDEAIAFLKSRQGKTVELKEVGHSEPQHRAFMAYMMFDWKTNFREKFSFDVYRARMALAVGHVEVMKRKVSKETIYKMLEDLNKASEAGKYFIDYELPKSMSFSKAGASEFNTLVEKATALIHERTGVSFEEHIAKSKQYEEA